VGLSPQNRLYFYRPCEVCDQTNCRISSLFAGARDTVLGVLEKKALPARKNSAWELSLS